MLGRGTRFGFVLAQGGLVALAAAALAHSELRVASHAASEISARVNAHLILGEREAVLVDATMTQSDADAVADLVERSGRTLVSVFITNSQPDKYLGLPGILARFPDARVVSTPEVVGDIEARGPGYLERLRGRYGDRIAERLVVPEPIASEGLQLEGHEIRIHRFRGGECPHAAALYVPSLRALLPGAIVFQGSHPFLRERDIPGWRRHLAWIREHGAIDTIYPGHGAVTDLAVVDAMERYLDDFERAVALGDPDAAVAFMVERYPDYALARLLREYSVPAYLGSRAPGR